jgi:acyl-CoA synthetase (AMP-forming)/AMP-acid ligase II
MTIPRDIAAAIRERAALHPDREALVGRHRRYSFAEFDRTIDGAAAGLAAMGVRPGDRIAATARNDPDIVIAFHAVQRLGAIWVGIARQLAPTEKAFQLRDCGVSLYLADEAATDEIAPLRDGLPELRAIVDMEAANLDSAWRRLLRDHDGHAPPTIALDPHAPAIIGYTSGTTGFPKGVVHSQHNLLVATHFPDAPEVARQACVMQLAILNVMMNHGLGLLRHGITLVCVDRADAAGILEWVEREKLGGFRAPGPVIHDLLMRPDFTDIDLSRLTYLATAGAGASPRLRELYRERFGREMLDGYGLTEAPGVVTRRIAADPDPPENAIGRPLPHLDVRILDEAGRELPDGETGEICIRAVQSGEMAGFYTPMLGYWRNPEATARALRGGWLHTGDLGYRDPSGVLVLNARSTDMILRGGANIYPREIERVLQQDPRVREAIAFGVPDERLGQIVAAAVEIDEAANADAIKAELIARSQAELARYKRPERWIVSTALPRNSMGKVERARLRAMAAPERI